MSRNSRFRSALHTLGVIEMYAALFALGAIVTIIALQVVSRYIFSSPLVWAEELASYLLIWLGFLAAAVTHKQRRHVSIRIFNAPPDTFRGRALFGLAELAVIFLTVSILLFVPVAMDIESRAQSIGLPINIAKHWFFSVPLSLSMASILLTSVYGLASLVRGREDATLAILGQFGDHSAPDLEASEAALADDLR